MTTIAGSAAEGVICCDSNITDGAQKWVCRKVERIDGALIGTAGDAIECEKFLDWARKGRRGRKPKLDEDEFNALELNERGLFWYDNKCLPMALEEPFAIGSGSLAARAAIYCGRSVAEAVEVACRVDAGSAGPVQVYRLRELAESKKEQA